MRTEGLSHKLSAVLKTLGGPGILLLLLGLALGNDTLTTAGVTLLVGAGGAGAAGYAAAPDVTSFDPELNVPGGGPAPDPAS